MKYSLLILLFGLVVVIGGGFAWLALADMPVHQQEMIVHVPIGQ